MQASRGQAFINRITTHPHRVLASVFLISFSLVALILPLLPLDPEGLDVIHSLAKPSIQHFSERMRWEEIIFPEFFTGEGFPLWWAFFPCS